MLDFVAGELGSGQPDIVIYCVFYFINDAGIDSVYPLTLLSRILEPALPLIRQFNRTLVDSRVIHFTKKGCNGASLFPYTVLKRPNISIRALRWLRGARIRSTK
jgi:hypothetical protein